MREYPASPPMQTLLAVTPYRFWPVLLSGSPPKIAVHSNLLKKIAAKKPMNVERLTTDPALI